MQVTITVEDVLKNGCPSMELRFKTSYAKEMANASPTDALLVGTALQRAWASKELISIVERLCAPELAAGGTQLHVVK